MEFFEGKPSAAYVSHESLVDCVAIGQGGVSDRGAWERENERFFFFAGLTLPTKPLQGANNSHIVTPCHM